jgi:hypothetical protein
MGASRRLDNARSFAMPANLPPATAAVALPYFRLVSFLLGGSVMLGLLLLVSSFARYSLAH